MKFAALALALLLAVGSHAASLQADAPSALQQLRSAIYPFLGETNTLLKNSLVHFDGTAFESHKGRVEQGLDQAHNQLMQFLTSAAPYTDTVLTQVLDATATFREKIQADISSLRTSLQPQREKLWDSIVKHVEEYRMQLDEIYKKHEADMKNLHEKLVIDLASLHAKFQTNLEETKSHLIPIAEAVRAKINENLVAMKEMMAPYVQEYKEQFDQAVQQFKDQVTNMNAEELQNYAASLVEKAKANLQSN